MIKFRSARIEDYKIITAVHNLAFSNFFLTSLGQKFLENYYKSCLKYSGTIAFCAINENNEVIGFVLGSLKSKGFYKVILLNNFLSFLLNSVHLVFEKPKALFRLIKNLDKAPLNIDDGYYSEVLSIGVLPNENGKGTGKYLLNHFEQEAFKRGSTKVTLTTDYYENDAVLAFYKNQGYNIFYEFTSYPSRKMYKLIKDINLFKSN